MKSRKILIVIMLLCSLSLLSSCKKEKKEMINIKMIHLPHELAVLEYKFNNAAVISKNKGDDVFSKLLKKDRTMFVEYKVRVKIGINTDEIVQNDRTIIIPEPKVLSVYDDSSTYEYIISPDSWFFKNKIENEIIKEKISIANETLKNKIQESNETMNQAQELAEAQIKNLIDSIYKNNNFKYERK